MTSVREAQVFQWMLLAEHLDDHAGKRNRPSEADLRSLAELVETFYHVIGVDGSPAFPAVLPAVVDSERPTPFYPPPPQEAIWRDAPVGERACFVYGEINQEVVVLLRAAGLHRGAGDGVLAIWNNFRAALGDVPESLKK